MPGSMRTGVSGKRAALLVALVAWPGASLQAQDAPLRWAKRLLGCEPPAVFYSAQHQPGRRPCCPIMEGVCPGGVSCPAAGVCPADGAACVPAPITPRPNVVL